MNQTEQLEQKVWLEYEQMCQEGRNDDTLGFWNEYISKNINRSMGYEGVGDVHLTMGNDEKAIKALKQAVKLDPDSANARYLLGFAYSRRSEYKKSVEHLLEAHKLQPKEAEVARCLGWGVFQMGKREEGIVILQQASLASPHDPLIMADLLMCYIEMRDAARADELVRVLSRSHRNHPFIRHKLKQWQEMGFLEEGDKGEIGLRKECKSMMNVLEKQSYK